MKKYFFSNNSNRLVIFCCLLQLQYNYHKKFLDWRAASIIIGASLNCFRTKKCLVIHILLTIYWKTIVVGFTYLIRHFHTYFTHGHPIHLMIGFCLIKYVFLKNCTQIIRFFKCK